MEQYSLYSNDIREYLSTRPWPKGFIYSVVEYPEHLGIRLYVDNFAKFDVADQEQIMRVVKEVIERIRKDGIPCYLERVQSTRER